jgi:hypothetical protein
MRRFQQRLDEPLVNLEQELLFTANVVIQPSTLQARGFDEILDRGRVVACRRERVSRRVHDLLPTCLIRFARSPSGFYRLRFSHLPLL